MTNTPIQRGYYAVGSNRSTPRIWLQGGNLSSANFIKGTPYQVIFNIDDQTIILRTLESANSNSRVVSGRKKANGEYAPIIDLATFDLLDVTQGAKRIRADFYPNEIIISIHHEETKQKDREERLRANLAKGEITKGVLCAGIGMSLAAGHDGLAEKGISCRTEFIVDRERKYLDVAQQNNHAISSSTQIFEGSLEEIETDLLGFVDVLSFSLPCTGQGSSGKAKNQIKFAEEHKTDATAILGLMRSIDACQPSILVSENVIQLRIQRPTFC
jgi:DNA (cytosine-5)-methyltransferase 1